jgi:SAM-dependent methyltransferase
MMTLALYAALAIGLIQFWSIVGLGIARAAAFASCMLLTFWMVRRMPAIPSLKEMAAYSAKPLLGGAAAAAFYATAFLLVDRAHPSPSYILTAAEQTVLLAVSGGVCLAVCGLLGVREARAVWRLVPVTKLRERALLVIGNVSAGPRIRTDRVFGALKRLSPNGKSVLDAGCAEGNGAIRCAALYPDSDVVGCDIDDSALQRAEARRQALGLQRLRFRRGDLTSDLGDSCYEIIICVDVLEHIGPDELAMRTLYRALKPGGHLVIHVPATPPRRIFPWLRDWHYTGHVRDGYSPEGLFARLQANGLSVDRAQGTFGRAGAFAWEVSETLRSIVPPLRFLAFPIVAMGAVLDRNTPTAKGNGLLVVAHRSAGGGAEIAGEETSGGGKAGDAPALRRLRTVEDGAEL